MSNLVDLQSEEEVVQVPKRSKGEKKEKKKSKKEIIEQDVEDDSKSSKKRKREALPEEIEIDVNLPEPASKKAARKAKKSKTQPTTSGATSGTEDAKPETQAGEQSEAKDQAGKRSEHSVWIGNLPWTATKDTLRAFLTENAEIKAEEITRVHMPAPKQPPRPNWVSEKPQNKGFAYVDFSTQLAMYSAIALTETRLDRRALLIKNSKNFEGRPDKPKTEEEINGAKDKGKELKAPSRKIFVGNLAFETSKEDLEEHFGQCGSVEHIHMATFEDSGKSKGYAWVTFEDIEAATSAVKGYIYKGPSASKDEAEDDADMHGKSKKRKFRLNKLMGRDLRCEFAEDSTTRYNKRFGKEKKEDQADAIVEDDSNQPFQHRKKPYTLPGKLHRQQGKFGSRGKIDPRSIKSGAAHTNAPRASAAIVESKGKKTTFD